MATQRPRLPGSQGVDARHTWKKTGLPKQGPHFPGPEITREFDLGGVIIARLFKRREIMFLPPSVCSFVRLFVFLCVCFFLTFFVCERDISKTGKHISILFYSRSPSDKSKNPIEFGDKQIQNGRPTSTYVRNLFLPIRQYWIEILTSNLVCGCLD